MDPTMTRDLGDGRELSILPLTYGKAKLVIGRVGALAYDDGW